MEDYPDLVTEGNLTDGFINQHGGNGLFCLSFSRWRLFKIYTRFEFRNKFHTVWLYPHNGPSFLFYEFVLAREIFMLQNFENYSKNSKPTTEYENCTHQHLHAWFGKHKNLATGWRGSAPRKQKKRNRFLFRASVFWQALDWEGFLASEIRR